MRDCHCGKRKTVTKLQNWNRIENLKYNVFSGFTKTRNKKKKISSHNFLTQRVCFALETKGRKVDKKWNTAVCRRNKFFSGQQTLFKCSGAKCREWICWGVAWNYFWDISVCKNLTFVAMMIGSRCLHFFCFWFPVTGLSVSFLLHPCSQKVSLRTVQWISRRLFLQWRWVAITSAANRGWKCSRRVPCLCADTSCFAFFRKRENDLSTTWHPTRIGLCCRSSFEWQLQRAI